MNASRLCRHGLVILAILCVAATAAAEPGRTVRGELVVLPGSTTQFRIVGHRGTYTAPSGMDIVALDGKTVDVELSSSGRVAQIVHRPVPIDHVEHGWSTVRGQLIVRDPASGRFTFYGDPETYVAPAGVNIAAYDNRMVEAKFDENGRVTELVPVGPAPSQVLAPAAASTGTCSYGGRTYSAGAAVCQAGTQYRCDGTHWQSLGIACDVTAADAPVQAPPVRMSRSCAIGDATVADGSSVCRSGTTHRCDDGVWINLGTPCR